MLRPRLTVLEVALVFLFIDAQALKKPSVGEQSKKLQQTLRLLLLRSRHYHGI